MKQQVVFMTGGTPAENFESYYDFLQQQEYDPYEELFLNWNKTLGEKLGDEYEYLRVPLRESSYADYKAWKIMFEKMFPYLRDDMILIVTSLGASFMLKYFWENDFPVRIKKLMFVCPAVWNTPEEKLGSFAFDLEQATRLRRWVDEIYIYHSKDDTIVPFEQSLELNSYFPEAQFREYFDRGHFFMQEDFPEIIEDIKK